MRSEWMAYMRLGIHTILSARLLVLAWAIIWFTTVPLSHTHLPDTDRQASQGGLAHTIFSPDLPGEFFHFSPAYHGPFPQLSNRASNSSELGFVFSAWQPGAPDALSVDSLLDPPFLSRSVLEPYTVHPRTVVFTASRSPRPPPSLVPS